MCLKDYSMSSPNEPPGQCLCLKLRYALNAVNFCRKCGDCGECGEKIFHRISYKNSQRNSPHFLQNFTAFAFQHLLNLI